MGKLEDRLKSFAETESFYGKGPLSVALVLTRQAAEMSFPIAEDAFYTAKKGQVSGLGKGATQKVLSDYGITQVLAEEGGRTSRGSIGRMQVYLRFLNQLVADGLGDLPKIEAWWVERVREHFASKPIRMKLDKSKSMTSIIRETVETAFKRQRERPGHMVAGAVMQHLVGAKLQLAMPAIEIKHHGSSVADAPSGRQGDFLLADTVIHVTTAPTEGLIEKCVKNIGSSLHPIIITTESGVGGANALTKAANIADRVDILEIAQFITTNVVEWIGFCQDKRPLSIAKLVETYNQLITEHESDPSLKISLD